jgi:hypothetical protein
MNNIAMEMATLGIHKEIFMNNIDEILRLAEQCESEVKLGYCNNVILVEREKDDFVQECISIREELNNEMIKLKDGFEAFIEVGNEARKILDRIVL